VHSTSAVVCATPKAHALETPKFLLELGSGAFGRYLGVDGVMKVGLYYDISGLVKGRDPSLYLALSLHAMPSTML
jgi:hypothetical protein